MGIEIKLDKQSRNLMIGSLVIEDPIIVNKASWPSLEAKIKEANPTGDANGLFREVRSAAKELWLNKDKSNIQIYANLNNGGIIDTPTLQEYWSNQSRSERVESYGPSTTKVYEDVYNKNAGELKKTFGKGLWKSLSKADERTNKSLAKLYSYLDDEQQQDPRNKQILGNLSRIDYALMSAITKQAEPHLKAGSLTLDEIDWIVTHKGDFGLQETKAESIANMVNIVVDLQLMSAETGKEIKAINLDPSKVIEKHHELSSLSKDASYFSEEEFGILRGVPKIIELEKGQAVLLDSPRALYLTHVEQDICTQTYVERVQRGILRLYNLIDQRGKKSTVQVNLEKGLPVSLTQHTGKANISPNHLHIELRQQLEVSLIRDKALIDILVDNKEKSRETDQRLESLESTLDRKPMHEQLADFLATHAKPSESLEKTDSQEMDNS